MIKNKRVMALLPWSLHFYAESLKIKLIHLVLNDIKNQKHGAKPEDLFYIKSSRQRFLRVDI